MAFAFRGFDITSKFTIFELLSPLGRRAANLHLESPPSNAICSRGLLEPYEQFPGLCVAEPANCDVMAKAKSSMNDLLRSPRLLIGLFVVALTLEILLGQGDGGEAFFQGCLDFLRRLGLW
jgi:hypothetical protein